jgi:two-component system, chemotaxis family, protein-glutamate methylesterase/glutaminase
VANDGGTVLNAARTRRDVLVLGASAGGLQAVSGLLRRIPTDLPVVKLLVLHRSPYGPPTLAEVLARLSGHRIEEPANGAMITTDRVYLAPRDMHLTVKADRMRVSRDVKEHSTRPAVDPLFRSAAVAFGPRVIGILLSGAGDDGVMGLLRIKAAGGMALVQTPSEAEHAWMPTNALRFDRVDAALEIGRLGPVVTALARGDAVRPE